MAKGFSLKIIILLIHHLDLGQTRERVLNILHNINSSQDGKLAESACLWGKIFISNFSSAFFMC